MRVLSEHEQNHLLKLRESFRVALLRLASDYDLPQARDLAERITFRC